MTRAEAMRDVMRALDNLEDRDVHDHESRHLTVMAMFQCIDWREVSIDAIRDLFRLVVERAPMGWVEALADHARGEVECCQQIRAEIVRDEVKARAQVTPQEVN